MDAYQLTFQTWDKLAIQYQDKFMDLDLYNDTYDLFCECVTKRGAEILEIGCGPGNITKYILSKRPDVKFLGTDVSANMINLAQKNNPAASFKELDCRSVNELNQKFDGILCGFVVPYLSIADVKKLITDCSSLLNQGGIFYMSLIEGAYDESRMETSSDGKHNLFVYYYQEQQLLNMFRDNNFESISVIRKDYQKGAGSKSTHLIFIANKK